MNGPNPCDAYRASGSAFKDSIENKDPSLINNRQAGRRNRGRSNGRPNNGNNRGSGENGNRIDSRARGNAPQLLEKYRNLARDAQLAGDRVNTEYYLQFADHYFRVIADNRSRQEEQQSRYRRNDEPFDDEGDRGGYSAYDDGPMMATEADRHQPRPQSGAADERMDSDEQDAPRPRTEQAERPRREPREYREPREARQPRQDREPRQEREPREQREPRQDREPRPVYEPREPRQEQTQPTPQQEQQDEQPRAEREARPARGRRPRRESSEVVSQEQDAPGLDLAVLPPSISRADNDTADSAPAPAAEEAPAPKRRGRPRKVTVEAAE